MAKLHSKSKMTHNHLFILGGLKSFTTFKLHFKPCRKRLEKSILQKWILNRCRVQLIFKCFENQVYLHCVTMPLRHLKVKIG